MRFYFSVSLALLKVSCEFDPWAQSPISSETANRRLCPRFILLRAISAVRSLAHSYHYGDGRVVRRCWVNLQCRGVLLIWITVGQGPIVFAVGVGGGCLDIFSLIYHFSFLSPFLWETARYRLKYCLKGPLSPKQPTNQNHTTTAMIPSRIHKMNGHEAYRCHFSLSPVPKAVNS